MRKVTEQTVRQDLGVIGLNFKTGGKIVYLVGYIKLAGVAYLFGTIWVFLFQCYRYPISVR
jgi:hypothetical protein